MSLSTNPSGWLLPQAFPHSRLLSTGVVSLSRPGAIESVLGLHFETASVSTPQHFLLFKPFLLRLAVN